MNDAPFPPPLPENHFLRKIDWQLFGHLTFSDYLPEDKRVSMFFILMRTLAKPHRVYWTELLWVLKQEYGKGTDIPHFHFLVAGMPQPATSAKSCRQLRDTWRQVGGGLSRIEPYNPTLSGRDYILKRSGEKSGNVREGSDKIEDTCGLMLSKSIPVRLKRRS